LVLGVIVSANVPICFRVYQYCNLARLGEDLNVSGEDLNVSGGEILETVCICEEDQPRGHKIICSIFIHPAL
jgi:hypothetical protein